MTDTSMRLRPGRFRAVAVAVSSVLLVGGAADASEINSSPAALAAIAKSGLDPIAEAR
jgi:hypothetical protein